MLRSSLAGASLRAASGARAPGAKLAAQTAAVLRSIVSAGPALPPALASALPLVHATAATSSTATTSRSRAPPTSFLRPFAAALASPRFARMLRPADVPKHLRAPLAAALLSFSSAASASGTDPAAAAGKKDGEAAKADGKADAAGASAEANSSADKKADTEAEGEKASSSSKDGEGAKTDGKDGEDASKKDSQGAGEKKKKKKKKASAPPEEELAQEDIELADRRARKGWFRRFLRNISSFFGKLYRYYRENIVFGTAAIVGLGFIAVGLQQLYTYAIAVVGRLATRIAKGDESCLPLVEQVAGYLTKSPTLARVVLFTWGPKFFAGLLYADHRTDYVHIMAGSHLFLAMCRYDFFLDHFKNDDNAWNNFFSRLDAVDVDIRIRTLQTMILLVENSDMREYFDPGYVLSLLTYRGRYAATVPLDLQDKKLSALGLRAIMADVPDPNVEFDNLIIDFLRAYTVYRPDFVLETVEYLEVDITRALSKSIFERGRRIFHEGDTLNGLYTMACVFPLIEREQQTAMLLENWATNGATPENPDGKPGTSYRARLEAEGLGALLLPGKYDALMAHEDDSNPLWATQVARSLLSGGDIQRDKRRNAHTDAIIILTRAAEKIKSYYQTNAGNIAKAAADSTARHRLSPATAKSVVLAAAVPLPGETEVFAMLTELLLESGRTDEALHYASQFRLMQPMRPQPLIELARVHCARKNPEAAVAAARAALEIDANSAPAAAELAKAFYASGAFLRAIRTADGVYEKYNDQMDFAAVSALDREKERTTLEAQLGKDLRKLPMLPLWEGDAGLCAVAECIVVKLLSAQQLGDTKAVKALTAQLHDFDPFVANPQGGSINGGVSTRGPVVSLRMGVLFEPDGTIITDPAVVRKRYAERDAILAKAPAKGKFFERVEKMKRDAAAEEERAKLEREQRRRDAIAAARERLLERANATAAAKVVVVEETRVVPIADGGR